MAHVVTHNLGGLPSGASWPVQDRFLASKASVIAVLLREHGESPGLSVIHRIPVEWPDCSQGSTALCDVPSAFKTRRPTLARRA